jgi:hypothetical protein
MEWLIPLFALVSLTGLVLLGLIRKNRPKEFNALILLAATMAIYHLGDTLLWSDWGDYEISRRIASIGFYLEIPAMLLLLYFIIPIERQSIFYRILSLIFYIPWVYAIIMIGKSPIVFLEGHGTYDEDFVYMIILAFVLSAVFIAWTSFLSVGWNKDLHLKKLSNNLGWGVIIFTILYLIIFSSIETLGVDLTWLFGLVSVFFILSLWMKACPALTRTGSID